MNKTFVVLDPATSLNNKTGSWRSICPKYVKRLPPCNVTCPAGENIQQWLSFAREGNFLKAWEIITKDNPFPAIMGRVCYHTCEKICNRAQLDGSVNINRIEKLIGDIAIANEWQFENSSSVSGKKVLIIGGAGYIGLAVTRELLAAGYEVTIFDSLLHGTEPLDFIENKLGLAFIQADTRDIAALDAAIKGHNSVILLASLVGQPACDLDPDGALEVNYLATLNVLETCRERGVSRLVFTSTDSCYGTREGEKLDEDSPLAPISLYAELKAQAEERILSSPQTPGFSPVVLRLATVYGISQRPRFDLAVNLLVREMTLKGQATIFSGEQWRPLVHVRDVAQAFRLTLDAPVELIDRQIFNVGSDDQNIQFKDLAKLLSRLRPDGIVNFTPAEADLRDYFVKFGKIKNILGFEPSMTILEGMLELRDWLNLGFPADPYAAKWRDA
jgi:nucleoside-diphosphate-sugar epimerase